MRVGGKLKLRKRVCLGMEACPLQYLPVPFKDAWRMHMGHGGAGDSIMHACHCMCMSAQNAEAAHGDEELVVRTVCNSCRMNVPWLTGKVCLPVCNMLL